MVTICNVVCAILVLVRTKHYPPPKPCSSAQCGTSSVSMTHTVAPPRHRSRWRRAARAPHTSTHSRYPPASCPSRGSLPPLHLLFLLSHSTLPHSHLGRSLRLRLGRCATATDCCALPRQQDRSPSASRGCRLCSTRTCRSSAGEPVGANPPLYTKKNGKGTGISSLRSEEFLFKRVVVKVSSSKKGCE